MSDGQRRAWRNACPETLDGTASKGTLMLLLCWADLHPGKEQISTEMLLKVVGGNPTFFKEYFGLLVPEGIS